MDFEVAVKRLGEIASMLEKENVSLEDALKEVFRGQKEE